MLSLPFTLIPRYHNSSHSVILYSSPVHLPGDWSVMRFMGSLVDLDILCGLKRFLGRPVLIFLVSEDITLAALPAMLPCWPGNAEWVPWQSEYREIQSEYHEIQSILKYSEYLEIQWILWNRVSTLKYRVSTLKYGVSTLKYRVQHAPWNTQRVPWMPDLGYTGMSHPLIWIPENDAQYIRVWVTFWRGASEKSIIQNFTTPTCIHVPVCIYNIMILYNFLYHFFLL